MKRAIALFLALIFVFGLIPVSALADESVSLTIGYDDDTPTQDKAVDVSGIPGANASPSRLLVASPDDTVTVTAPKYNAAGALFQSFVVDSTDYPSGETCTVDGTAAGAVVVTANYEQQVELTLAGGAKIGTNKTYEAQAAGDTFSEITAPATTDGNAFLGWRLTGPSNAIAYLGGGTLPTTATIAADTFAATLVEGKGAKLTLTATYAGKTYTGTFDSTGGIAVAKGSLPGGDSFPGEAPLTATAGETVFVRVAKKGTINTPLPDRKVTGAAYNALDNDGNVVSGSTTQLTPVEDGEDYSIYSFVMPASNISIYASYEYKITLGGATGALGSGSAGETAWWVAPGTRNTITLDEDASGRNVSTWTFSPTLPTAKQDAVNDKVVYGDVGTQPSELKRTATFTMPDQSLAIGITYDRELANSALTFVNATAKVTPVGQDELTATSPATVKEGSAVKLTAVCPPEMAGMKFKQWVAEGDAEFKAAVAAGTKSGSELTFVMPKVGGTLTAQFQGAYALTTSGASKYSVNGAETTGDALGAEVFYGDTVVVTTAKTAFDWRYSPAKPSGAAENATAKTTTFTVASDSGIEALTVAAKDKYALNVNGGTFTPATPIAAGDTVTITATPGAGTEFSKWVAISGITNSEFTDPNLGTTTFTMPASAVEVTALTGAVHTARVTNDGNNTSATSPTIKAVNAVSASNTVLASAGKALTATAAATGTNSAGKATVFTGWTAKSGTTDVALTKDGVALPASAYEARVLNFDMHTADVTLTATYTADFATVTTVDSITGATSGANYAEGASVTITAPAHAGYEFSYWKFVYTDKTTGTVQTKTDLANSSYTFTIGGTSDIALAAVTATAYYTRLPRLTLQSASASAAGDLTMVYGAKSVSSAANQTSISEYWHDGEAVAITAAPTVTGAGGATQTFSRWVLISGSAVIADAGSASTTATMGTADAVIAAKYGDELLLTYKLAERDSTQLYDNWLYAYKTAGDSVQLTADDPDGTFVEWVVEPSTLAHTVSGAKNRVLSFTMPTSDVKAYPIYTHNLIVADNAEYMVSGGAWTKGSGLPVAVQSGVSVSIRPIVDAIGTQETGKLLFKSWRTNTTLVKETPAEQTFTMPPEDVELSVNYQTYTLSVVRTVNGTEELHSLRPGQIITITSEEASGGRCFNYWTHTGGLTFTVVDKKFDEKDSGRLVSQRITVTMPASDAFIHGWYETYPRYDYWNTDAFIKVEGEPKRYYAQLEYFQAWDLKVYYYSSLTAPGILVNPSDYTVQVMKVGTTELGTSSDMCFTQVGDFYLLVTMYVNGHQMAPAVPHMNTASTYLHCTASRAEFIQAFTKPARTVYYEGEEVEKDGLDVILRSADHTTGEIRYSTLRELDESEYKLKPWGTGWDADGKTNTKLPTQEQIYDNWLASKFGYKFEGGRYYVCMEITDCFDYTQYNTDGSYMRMEYIVNDAKDYIWVEVKKPASNITLAAENAGAKDVVSNVPTATSPTVSWVITQDLAQTNNRQLRVGVDGFASDMDKAAAVEHINSDSNVAYLVATTNPLVYDVVLKSTGVTKITFRALGNKNIEATCEITVKTDTTQVAMTSMKLNQSSMNLYVGTDITLYPSAYEPSNADKACNWYVEFTDGLAPQNAEYYVSVSAAGAVDVLKYTDRTVRVWALPSYPAGQNTLDKAKANNCVYAYCDITVLQIPVDNMTLYPAAMTMYRLATRSLKATMYPEAASDKTIRWTSSDSSVASVDNDGNVTANKLGTATITATSESNTKVFQTCKVTVAESVLLTGLMLNKTSATLGIDDSLVLTPYYTPANATTKSVTWASNATTVATVDANGKVRGLSEGVAVITATSTDGTGKQASCVVSVSTIVASAVVLNKQTLALIEDETEQLAATVYPTNVSIGKVLWTSSNEKVATVDPDGVVTATGGGSAVITATAKDASTKYADCVVAVTAKIPVTAITLNLGDFDILLNDTTVLTASVTPANATYKLAWSSSNPAVASIDEKGKVSGLTTGTTVITCKAGDMTKAITLNVVTKVYSNGKVVNCSRRVNVRASSSGTSAIVGYAYLGDVYKVLDSTGNWYKIQYNASTVAYIWSRYLNATQTSAGYTSAGKVGATTDTTGTTPAPTTTAKTLTITNCSYCVNVRSGAGTTFSKLGYAYKDEVLTYTGTSNDWYIITYNGGTGYVSSQFVKVN